MSDPIAVHAPLFGQDEHIEHRRKSHRDGFIPPSVPFAERQFKKMIEDNAKLWWENITGPSAFVHAIADSLIGGKSVALSLPVRLPWADQMVTSVHQLLHENDPELIVDVVNCEEEFWNTDDPDVFQFLLNRYAHPENRSGYRRTSGISEQEYILNKKILSNRIIWIQNASSGQFAKWLRFCRDFHPKNRYSGLFVMETRNDSAQIGSYSGMNRLRYSDYTGYYDLLLFNNILCSKGQGRDSEKQYRAALCTLLCCGDTELSATLSECIDQIGDEPIRILQKIRSESGLDGGPKDENHPFTLLETGNLRPLECAVWKAQLQVIYPLLEEERIQMIELYRTRIEEALHTEYYDNNRNCRQYVTQFGEQLTDVLDVELGTLYRMNCIRQADDENCYLLYLPMEADRHHLALLRDMRNQIAHMNPCSAELVEEFLKQYPYSWLSFP